MNEKQNIVNGNINSNLFTRFPTAVAQSPHMWKVGCLNPVRDNPVIKTGSDSSTAKRSATVVSAWVPGYDNYERMPRVPVGGKLKNPHYAIATIAEFAALHQ